jgi:murein DD-endopeptidase MepM/ murein hydrolase activator NlpD
MVFFAAVALTICLGNPVPGPVIAPFAPVGQYGGHWGVDFAASFGDAVVAPITGTVTFAGSVAGMNTVTIQPAPGVKVSVSYLSSIAVVTGEVVARGDLIGNAGLAHGTSGVHLSVRIDDVYVDPAGLFSCQPTDITRALRLVTPPQPYPRRRADRDFRRHIRPGALRSSGRS